MNELVFEYENNQQRQQCEWHAAEIERFNRNEAECRYQQGRHLIAVKATLNNSRPVFLAWLEWRLGCCEQTAVNYMDFAKFIDNNPNGLEIRSATLGYRVARLPEPVQREILEKEAFTETQAQPIIDEAHRREWYEGMVDYLTKGPPKDLEQRMGDVLHWIERDKHDPVLAPVAKKLYAEHRETFARLADRDIAAAWELDGEEWEWEFTEFDRGVEIRILDSRQADVPVMEYHWEPWRDSKAKTYAAARCRAWLKAEGSSEKLMPAYNNEIDPEVE